MNVDASSSTGIITVMMVRKDEDDEDIFDAHVGCWEEVWRLRNLDKTCNLISFKSFFWLGSTSTKVGEGIDDKEDALSACRVKLLRLLGLPSPCSIHGEMLDRLCDMGGCQAAPEPVARWLLLSL